MENDPARDARPLIHFTAPQNWLNDPNGLIKWGDTYHLFFQYNPSAPHWDLIHWGHATSTDLMSWQHQPIALRPDTMWDSAGCFSGCAIDNDGVPTLFYTGVTAREDGSGLEERVLMATSTDGLQTWAKHSEPVLWAAPPEIDSMGGRDPYVWKESDGSWRLIIGSGDRQRGGMILIYSSLDLTSWDYVGVLVEQSDLDNNPLTVGHVWECPNLVRLADRDVLIISVCDENGTREVVVIEGSLLDDRLHPAKVSLVDVENSYYAPQAFRLDQGRNVWLGWLRELSDPEVPSTWAGAMSVPREFAVDEHGQLGQRPAAEVDELRTDETALVSEPSRLSEPLTLALGDGVNDIELSAELRSGQTLDVLLNTESPAGPAVRIRVGLDEHDTPIILGSRTRVRIVTEARASHPVVLRLIVDHGIVEAFLGSGPSSVQRYYPAGVPLTQLRLSANHGDAQISAITSWRLADHASKAAVE